MNRIHIIGNLGDDPTMRYTANGKAVTELSIAVNERYGDNESTTWFRVIAWDRLAETAAQYLTKGREVYVEGRMQERSWEKDGQKQYRWELIANTIQFIGGAPGGGGRRDDGYDAAPQPQQGRGGGQEGRGAPQRAPAGRGDGQRGMAAPRGRGVVPPPPARGGYGGNGRDIEPDDLPF